MHRPPLPAMPRRVYAWCMPYHPNPNPNPNPNPTPNPNPNQGAPTRLTSPARRGLYIHTIATRAASLSRSRAGGRCSSMPSVT
eukprot:scaffold117636_cov45-Phaeocystis_antarctica.AAC.1